MKNTPEFTASITPPAWIMAGAGVSITPPASIPLWGDIKSETLRHSVEAAEKHNRQSWHNCSTDLVKDISRSAADLLVLPEEAMEDISLAYGEGAAKRELCSILDRKGEELPRPTRAHKAIASLATTRHVVGILTTNFDTLFEQALALAGVQFQVCNHDRLPTARMGLPVLKVHGSVDFPNTLQFTRGSYYRGLPEHYWAYLRSVMCSTHIVVVGYSGYDSDLFPLLYECIRDKSLRNTATIVNRQKPTVDSPLGRLLSLQNVNLAVQTADEFFCGSRSKHPSTERKASVLPSEEVVPVVAFLGLACRRNRPDLSHRVFWLLHDIGDTDRDRITMALAHFGKSLCEISSQDVSDEFFSGFFQVQEFAKSCSNLSSGLSLLTDWLVLSLWTLTRHALALWLRSQHSDYQGQLRRLSAFWNLLPSEIERLSPEKDTSEWRQFSKEIMKLLFSVLEGYRLRRDAVPGLLNVVKQARLDGYYELELDCIDLLNVCGAEVERYVFEVEVRVREICEVAGVSRGRQRLADIRVEPFALRSIVERHHWE